jgi:hypothetical protein
MISREEKDGEHASYSFNSIVDLNSNGQMIKKNAKQKEEEKKKKKKEKNE